VIQVITMLKRKQGTTHQEFLDYWRQHHGPLIASLSCAKYVRRYEQHAAVWPADGSGQPEPAYDGVAIQWFDSVESFYAHAMEPDQVEHRADVARFLDPAELRWTICEEPVVIIGSEAGAVPSPR
jgi:uncharacterized protein (TIGR02118 family)